MVFRVLVYFLVIEVGIFFGGVLGMDSEFLSVYGLSERAGYSFCIS